MKRARKAPHRAGMSFTTWEVTECEVPHAGDSLFKVASMSHYGTFSWSTSTEKSSATLPSRKSKCTSQCELQHTGWDHSTLAGGRSALAGTTALWWDHTAVARADH